MGRLPVFSQKPPEAAKPAPGTPSPATIDFQRQIRPILSDNCFLCHGPDKGTRMVDLRLDLKEGALSKRKTGFVVVPGKPDESLIIKRIFSEDKAFRMPPVFSHKTLTPVQKDTIRKWIEQGAPWKEHWAFAVPVKTALPDVAKPEWSANPIDRFVLTRMSANQLQPAPQANRRTLIRRVTLDLTGLPPAPAEVESFVADKDPKAYERLVDRLLTSPRYGEHRARYWLDAARYADTQGLHIDNYREMWPYRDWVIQAFNRNLPFDRFTVEQLAGDLLPSPTLDQRIASGFQRCNVTTNEGGAIPDEVAAIYAKDRADTTGTVWMGLTVGCATCHDHKFDPISQKDYYSLTSFFRNTTQWALDGNVADTPPVVVVPQGADRPRWETISSERATILKFISDSEAHPEPSFEKWLQSKKRKSLQSEPVPVAFAFDASPNLALADGVTLSTGPDDSTSSFRFDKSGILTTAIPAPAFANDHPFTVAAWVYTPKKHDGYTVAGQIEVVNGAKPKEVNRRGWVLDIARGNTGRDEVSPGFRIQSSYGKYLTARPGPGYAFKPETWYHVVYTYDGSRKRSGISLFVNGNFVPTYGMGEDTEPLKIAEIATAPVTLGGTTGKAAFEGGGLAAVRTFAAEVDESDAKVLQLGTLLDAARAKDTAELSVKERQALALYYAYRVDSATQARVKELRALDNARYAIAHRSPVTFVMQERADSEPTAHVLFRGMYDQPKDEVHGKVPSVLPPLPQSYPKNRLGLAKWLVDSDNPLTARVTVNRMWQEVFGTGIVKTVEDFGSQGEPPSNPELLDWLAVDFRESGWDVKRFYRLLVTSEAYKQSSASTPEKTAKDPENRLLSHGPHFRMDGEMIRDYALSVSGLLQANIGGPSVKPYQPPNIWETVAMEQSNTKAYQADHGPALYRRSMYTFWKRSAPPASMDIMNAPSREVCTVRRERTNTPLQALVTMNDPQFVEAARVLAQGALQRNTGNFKGQVDYMSHLLLARSLAANELEIVGRSYRDFLRYYDSTPADAAKLLSVGESKADAHLSKPELAAMTMVANELLNLDEVLTK